MTTTRTTASRPNRHPADCMRCGERVDPGFGYIVGKTPRGWVIRHNECPEQAERARWAAALQPVAAKVTADNGKAFGEAMVQLDRKYWPFMDPTFGNVDEIVMHAMDAWNDRQDGVEDRG